MQGGLPFNIKIDAKNFAGVLAPCSNRPFVHFMVPYSGNKKFIDQKSGCIRKKLAEQNPSYHRRLAIYGLGGVGYYNPIQ